jgi:hypothetical protein
MKARREFRNRDDVQVAVLDALVDRHVDGMTVFELRSQVDVDIDDLEDALAALKSDGLITAEDIDGRTRLTVADRVIPTGNEPADESFIDAIRRKIGL